MAESSTLFARYNLIRRIGIGGMAEVWKAQVTGPEGFTKTVAIKKVLPELSESRDFITMFVAEAKLVADLVHPNIVQVFDFGQAGRGEYYIAMEFVAGQDLYSLLKRAEKRRLKIPFEVALYIVIECAKGLAFAHSKTDPAGQPLGIVHRDMSPQNILLSYSGDVKITDFGIAKFANASEKTETGVVRGNAAYLSPEQAEQQPLDHRSDIFTLGAVFFELLTGKRLYTGNNPLDLVQQALSFRFPAAAVVGLPMEIQTVLQSMLRGDPSRRYQDAAEMEEALSDVLDFRGRTEAKRALISLIAQLFDAEKKAELSVVDPQPEQSISLQSPPALDAPTPLVPDATSRSFAPRSGGVKVSTSAGTKVVPEGPRSEATPGTFTQVLQVEPPAETQRVPEMERDPTGRSVVIPRAKRRFRPVFAAGLAGGFFLVGLLGTAALRYALRGDGPKPASSPIVKASVAPTKTKATPQSTDTALAVGATPAIPAPTPRPAAQRGRITVNAAPWCRVLIDGKEVADETPLENYSLTTGRHTLRFENPVEKFRQEKIVEIKAGQTLEIFVDVTKKTVKVSSR